MKKATDIILELYKNENITKKEVDILLDAIWGRNCCYNPLKLYPYTFDQAYKPEEQHKWTYSQKEQSNDYVYKIYDPNDPNYSNEPTMTTNNNTNVE